MNRNAMAEPQNILSPREGTVVEHNVPFFPFVFS